MVLSGDHGLGRRQHLRDRAEVAGFLGSDGGVTEVRKEAERGLLGTDGVPHSLEEGRAVPPDVHELQMSCTATEQAVRQRES